MRLISLDASPSSNLEWDISKSGEFFLDFNFSLFDPFDEAEFFARFLAVEEFSKRFPEAKKVILAKMDGNFSLRCKPSERLEQVLAEQTINKETVCADLFSQYLHRLASGLRDECQPFLLCEIGPEKKMEDLVLLFCRRRFEHFAFHFTERKIPIEGEQKIIISIPQDDKYDPFTFKNLFNALSGYKCIPEEHLNEHWDGVDVLIVQSETLGEIGERMLLGFEAAGGKVVYAKRGAKPIDLALLSE